MWTTQNAALFGSQLLKFAPKAVLPRPPRDLKGLPPSLARLGHLEVRLATSKRDIRKAQRLRYKVFFEEGGAVPDRASALVRRDRCAFDKICDHLLVIDHSATSKRLRLPKPKVVGCYRLLRQDIANVHSGFYSAQEFDLAPLLARHHGKKFLELGRSCVLPEYRSKRTIELLWQGIAAYINHHKIDVLIGCASFPETNVLKIAQALSFLDAQAKAKDDWHTRALPSRYVPMNILSTDAVDMKKALHALPPLIKAYLRIGAMFGEGAVIDHMFGTTDVLVVLPVENIDPRYMGHFGLNEMAA